MKYLRLNTFLVIASYFFTTMFSSCGKDGKSGSSYVAIYEPTADCYYFTSYTDNNPDVPYGFTYGHHYLTSPGSYQYNYYVSSACGYNDYHCWGSYYIESNNPGTSGGFLHSGNDGADKYYDLQCEWDGTTLSNYRMLQPLGPLTFDTTYITNGNRIRVTGTIVFGQKPSQSTLSKTKR